MREQVENMLAQSLSKIDALIDQGAIADPVVTAYLRSLEQRLEQGQTGDAITRAQIERLDGILGELSATEPDPG